MGHTKSGLREIYRRKAQECMAEADRYSALAARVVGDDSRARKQRGSYLAKAAKYRRAARAYVLRLAKMG